MLVDGHDVRDLTVRSLRAAIGLVLDEPFLFSATVRENIAYGRPDASDEDVRAAARAAGAEEFIDALPEGFDSEVGERGYTLSGGQRQRIAIARTLLADPAILILDDATSAIDVQVEEEIHAALRVLMEGRTTLVIAHRTLDHQPGRAGGAARGRPHRRRRHPRRADGHRAALRRGAGPHRGDRRGPRGPAPRRQQAAAAQPRGARRHATRAAPRPRRPRESCA